MKVVLLIEIPYSKLNVRFEGEVVRVKSKRSALPLQPKSAGPSKLSSAVVDSQPEAVTNRDSVVAVKLPEVQQRQSIAVQDTRGSKTQSVVQLDNQQRQSMLQDIRASKTQSIVQSDNSIQKKPSKGPTKQLQNLREYASSNEELDMIRQLEASLNVPEFVITEAEPEPKPSKKKERRRKSSVQNDDTDVVEKRQSMVLANDDLQVGQSALPPKQLPQFASQNLDSKDSTESLPRTLLKSLKSNIAAKSRSSMVPNPKVKDQRIAESIDFGNGYANVTEVVIVDKRKK